MITFGHEATPHPTHEARRKTLTPPEGVAKPPHIVTGPTTHLVRRYITPFNPSSNTPLLKMTSQTQVLQLQEALELIFEHLGPSPNTDTDSDNPTISRQHLLWVTKTCRTWSEPALNVLWRELDSTYPLLLLIPSLKLVNGTYVFDGPVEDNDILRFDSYARRVRCLSFRLPVDVNPVASHVYLVLQKLHHSTPLLPGLLSVHFPNVDRAFVDVSGAFLFLETTTVKSIELDNVGTNFEEFTRPFIATSARHIPNLKRLILRGQCSEEVLSYVSKYRKLQYLDLHPGRYISGDILEDLGTLPELTQLKLDMGSGQPPVSSSHRYRSTAPSALFQELQKLHIIGSPVSVARFLAHYFVPKDLRTLTLEFTADPFNGDWMDSWRHCFDLISSVTSLRSLTVLEFAASHVLSYALISPLSQLRNLEYLELSVTSLLTTDDELRDFVCSFANLRVLFLPNQSDQASLSFTSLQHISASCPKLEKLRLSLVANFDAPSDPDIIKNHKLKELLVGGPHYSWSIRQYVRTSRFLDALFPELQVIKGSGSSNAEEWEEIEHMVQTHQDVRRTARLLYGM
ncbi:hypothetical protein BDQ12DRAFT_223783 [Crucibulum laeve]|uniref:F-box domain-containing protein n=1 Tax=Crucibulum laeve TaxID=68775 RepID=A0A5C3LEH0_9AGAR|nr:hypothetical protein BDQ12DRAFT_223783 [Crucibulum laeve]